MAVNDGSANAPAGAPQFPNLLAAYGANRPAWEVAGVDYHVGVPQGLALKNPATISMSGVSVNTTTHIVTVTGNNVTLDGYDFSLNGGWQVTTQAANTKIANSNFVVGSNDLLPILGTLTASNLDIVNCTIDGAGHAPGLYGCLIAWRGSGFTVEYSWLKDSGGDMIDTIGGGGTFTVEHNLIQNAGMMPGAHGDYTQIYGGQHTVQVNYNTTTQDGGSTQGLITNAPDAYQGQLANNTMMGSVSYFTAAGRVPGPMTVENNYFDPSKAFGFEYPGSKPTSVFIHNVNMTNGSVIGSNAPSAPTPPPTASAPAAPSIASFSPDTGVVGDGITNANTLELKGTAAAGSTVKIYDGSTQIGSTTATSTGSWDYITQVLTDAKHTLTAKATNSSGQTSAASSALAVTVDTKAPVAPAIAGDTVNSANQVVVNGTAEAGSNIKVYDGTTQVGTATTTANGSWTVTTSALPVGSHNLIATATDAAGNVSVHSAPFDPVIQAPTAGGGTPSGGQPSSGGQNLVTNGSFETGDYTGWTWGGNYGPSSSHGVQTFINTGAESGKFAAGLGSVGSDGTLSQNVQTTAGQQYAVSFWLANHGSGPNDFTVTWNGQTELALANKSAQGYTQYSFTATGTAGTSHLEFDARQDPSYWSLDNVSVVAVGSPPSPPSPPSQPLPAANLVTNGSFETGDYTGWTLGGNYKPLSYGAQTYINTAAESGKFAAALGSVGSDGTLSQNVHTTAGQQYAVSFWLANNGSGPNDFTVTWNGQTELALANKSAQGYTEYSFTATGTAGTSHLEFDARQDPSHWSLDNVSVVAVGSSQPLPHFATGGSFTVGGQGGADSQLVQFMATPGEVVTITPVAVGFQPSQPLPHFATGGSFTVGGQGGTDSQLVQLMATPGEVVTITPPGGSTVKVASTTPTPLDLTNLQKHSNDTATIMGTSDAHSQIKLYDGTSLLGSVKAGAGGAWSFTTAQLSNAVHTFKAQEVDSTGHVVATSSGNAVLGSSSGHSTLTSTTGNDVLVGQGHSDTFVFAPNFGNDTVKGFIAGGSGHDSIQFSKTEFDSFASVLSHASQVGNDAVIATGSDSVTLKNVKIGALNSHDFHFA